MAKIDKGDKYSNIISTTGATTIVQLPLAFVHSGGVNIIIGLVNVTNNVGYSALFWSRTSNSSTNAYNLTIYPGDVNPSVNGNRCVGFSLRCLYPGSA